MENPERRNKLKQNCKNPEIDESCTKQRGLTNFECSDLECNEEIDRN